MKTNFKTQNKMGEVLDNCLLCVFHNADGTCGNTRSVMYGVKTNDNEHQLCSDRRYYTRNAFVKPKRKRKIESIYDYE